ncbi:helix-turn-helix domain-containing protein [Peribacillus saganii]|uniref:helix-turn-helix domain-containing protein n=1 Tax=Peribacillus saganii TaxID=2303992 RepID=UPI00131458A6|nr:helix-turn-helix domain-containing protein [Peribacillus saganii]
MKSKWTQQEVNYLQENVGIMKLSSIAKKLERSEQAVLSKMKRLGISNTKAQTGYLTTYELAALLKIDPSTIRGWIANHGLQYKKRATRTKRKCYFISPEDFWKWVELNREKIDFSKIEHQSIVPEPDWVEKERANAKPSVYKVWSVKEERKLMLLFSQGCTIKEVAGQLNRSIVSVQRKFQRLESC